jgi:cytochrome b subunit of formate dehydrogenase
MSHVFMVISLMKKFLYAMVLHVCTYIYICVYIYIYIYICIYVYYSSTVYHVGPNGWTQVWAGDTTDMFYKYYPLKTTKSIDEDKEKEVVSKIGGHGA